MYGESLFFTFGPIDQNNGAMHVRVNFTVVVKDVSHVRQIWEFAMNVTLMMGIILMGIFAVIPISGSFLLRVLLVIPAQI